MGILNKPHTFSPNTTILSSQVNADFDTLYNGINGNIDQNNLADDAVVTSKIADEAVTTAKLDDGAVTLPKLNADVAAGWLPLGATPATVTCNGNRSYSAVFSGTDLTDTLSPGMRLKLTRTVSAPTQCTDLESGSSQYYSAASASLAGMNFTDDFTCMAWIKLESYTGANQNIITRHSTNGWLFYINSSGQLIIQGVGGGTTDYITSYQSVPLGKWVHVAASLNMSAGDTSDSAIYIDGVSVPRAYTNGAATSLTQSGDLHIGNRTGASEYFDGKIAQVAVFSAVLSASTIRSYMSQTLSGSETSLVSAYSFNNTILDLNTTNNNDLTAQGSAVATATDSPFADRSNVPSSITSGTVDYGIVTKVSFSTDTTVTIQVPEGCAIPTSGGVSAVSYSTQKCPYGFPADAGKWRVESLILTSVNQTVSSNGVWVSLLVNITVPIGAWKLGYQGTLQDGTSGAAGGRSAFFILSSSTPTNTSYIQPLTTRILAGITATYQAATLSTMTDKTETSATTYTMYGAADSITATETLYIRGDQGRMQIYAELALL